MARQAKGLKASPRPVPSKNSILAYMHCRRCVETMPEGFSPQTWSRLSVGWTELGFQVWCNRHNVNIVHVDFEGQQHPAEQGGTPKKQ